MKKELWSFLAKKSVDREMSINDIIIERLNKYKEKFEKKLTSRDGMVS